jgi:hypothetical protein
VDEHEENGCNIQLARGPGRVDAVVAVLSRLEQVGRVAYVTA